MKAVTLDNIDDFVAGAAVLGAGGGWGPHIPMLMVKDAVRRYGPVPIVQPDDLPADGLVIPVGAGGAPTALIERFFEGSEWRIAVRALEKRLGRKAVALMAAELGGGNAVLPVAAAAELGLPVIDADGMRRCFPKVEMTLWQLEGVPASPGVVADTKGNVVLIEGVDNYEVERITRATLVQMGMMAVAAMYPMTAKRVQETSIIGSLTYCHEIGKRLRAVAGGAGNGYDDLLEFCEGRIVFTGKVIDLERRTEGGWNLGTVTLEHVEDSDRIMRLDFQNENLVALENGRPVVTSPDLITTLDVETAQAVLTDGLAYGQRLHVLATPAHERWLTPEAIDLVGPRAFGYDLDYVHFFEGATA